MGKSESRTTIGPLDGTTMFQYCSSFNTVLYKNDHLFSNRRYLMVALEGPRPISDPPWNCAWHDVNVQPSRCNPFSETPEVKSSHPRRSLDMSSPFGNKFDYFDLSNIDIMLINEVKMTVNVFAEQLWPCTFLMPSGEHADLCVQKFRKITICACEDPGKQDKSLNLSNAFPSHRTWWFVRQIE